MSTSTKTTIVSTGKRYRECIDITTLNNGKKESRTYHQELKNGQWTNRV